MSTTGCVGDCAYETIEREEKSVRPHLSTEVKIGGNEIFHWIHWKWLSLKNKITKNQI